MRKNVFFMVCALIFGILANMQAQTQDISLVGVPADFVDGPTDNSTLYPSLSTDGRYLAFISNVSTLVNDDTNSIPDAFVLDRTTGQIERVSVATAGTEATLGACCSEYAVVISGDGRFVAFSSVSEDLVPDDTNAVQDIFLHDRQTGLTTLVSVNDAGDKANGTSSYPSISSDGRYIAFQSEANNLVTNDSNGFRDIFVHDRQLATTVRVSLTHDGLQSNHDSFITLNHAISDDGRFVSFDSFADNLVPGDTNTVRDAFVFDRDADGDNIFDESGATTTVRVSVATDGTEGNGHLSESRQPALAGNGRFVVFQSYATNLVPNDTNLAGDMFIRDRDTDGDNVFDEPTAVSTERVSIDSSGGQSNGGSGGGDLTADGRFVIFYSTATNLIANDTNLQQDIFLHDRMTGETSRLSETSNGGEGNGSSNGGVLASAGGIAAFTSLASNLTANDNNQTFDVFLYDPNAPTTPTSYQLYLPVVIR